MSALVLLNLLNELGLRDKCEACRAFFTILQRVDKLNNTGTQMLDSIYHMTLT